MAEHGGVKWAQAGREMFSGNYSSHKLGEMPLPSPEGIEIAERTRILQPTMKNKLINMTRQFYNSIKICLITPKN